MLTNFNADLKVIYLLFLFINQIYVASHFTECDPGQRITIYLNKIEERMDRFCK